MTYKKYDYDVFESDGALARFLAQRSEVTLVSVRAKGMSGAVVAWFYTEEGLN
jgi:hypothetical protein